MYHSSSHSLTSCRVLVTSIYLIVRTPGEIIIIKCQYYKFCRFKYLGIALCYLVSSFDCTLPSAFLNYWSLAIDMLPSVTSNITNIITALLLQSKKLYSLLMSPFLIFMCYCYIVISVVLSYFLFINMFRSDVPGKDPFK